MEKSLAVPPKTEEKKGRSKDRHLQRQEESREEGTNGDAGK